MFDFIYIMKILFEEFSHMLRIFILTHYEYDIEPCFLISFNQNYNRKTIFRFVSSKLIGASFRIKKEDVLSPSKQIEEEMHLDQKFEDKDRLKELEKEINNLKKQIELFVMCKKTPCQQLGSNKETVDLLELHVQPSFAQSQPPASLPKELPPQAPPPPPPPPPPPQCKFIASRSGLPIQLVPDMNIKKNHEPSKKSNTNCIPTILSTEELNNVRLRPVIPNCKGGRGGRDVCHCRKCTTQFDTPNKKRYFDFTTNEKFNNSPTLAQSKHRVTETPMEFIAKGLSRKFDHTFCAADEHDMSSFMDEHLILATSFGSDEIVDK